MCAAAGPGRTRAASATAPKSRERVTARSPSAARLERRGLRSSHPPSAPRQGPRRRALLRAAGRRRPSSRGRPLARALQPRVPPGLRRVAARVPAHAPPRARGRAAADDGPLRRRDLLLGRPQERRILHDQLHANLRRLADGVPRGLPARRRSGTRPGVRAPRLRPAPSAHVSRRHGGGARLASPAAVQSTTGGQMIKLNSAQVWVHDQDEALTFYTEKLGMEVRADVTLPELGDFRWLAVGPVGQPEVAIVLMAIPGPPVMDQETAEQVKALMAKGFAGTIFLGTDDVYTDVEELKNRGV